MILILVDTSVLIDFFQENDNEQARKFRHILFTGASFGINVFIYQELLQGAATERDYNELKEYLDTQKFYQLKKGKESHADAARLYHKCRKQGYVISSAIDCLIAQTAIENN